MRTIVFFIFIMMVMSVPSFVSGDELPLKSRIESAALFKNGLVVIKKSVTVDKAGDYVLDDLLGAPVHGTLGVSSTASVQVLSQYREVVSEKWNLDRPDWPQGLEGQTIEIHFKDPSLTVLKGVVESPEKNSPWDRNYNPRRYYELYYSGSNAAPPSGAPFRLLLRTNDGLSLVDVSTVAFLNVLSSSPGFKVRKPVVVLAVGEVKQPPQRIELSYLTKGLSWAPAYRIDLIGPSELTIEQSGVVKNELVDLDEVELSLITGFPQVKFASVVSPLSPDTDWSRFFAQLNQPSSMDSALASNVVLQQREMNFNDTVPSPGMDYSSSLKGEGVDLYYRNIGKISLKEGAAMFVSLAKEATAYESIVEWTVPDTRSVDGSPVQDYERQQNPDKFREAAWDAISFKNPFAFPMTTGPVSIYSQGRFNGQSQSNWVNPGGSAVVYVTKALSIKTGFSEQEDAGEQRAQIRLGGRMFQKVTVMGELMVQNSRSQAVALRIRRQFSGDLLNASDAPTVVVREEGVYSVNKRHELKWSCSLQPGEEKKLTYSYTVLTPY